MQRRQVTRNERSSSELRELVWFASWMNSLDDHGMGLSENRLNPIVPNGFADHYPVFKWLFHWED